jgi:N-acetylneuraminic acid mutarotase
MRFTTVSLLLLVFLSILSVAKAQSGNTWVTKAPMKPPECVGRNDFTSSVVNGKIYVIGGPPDWSLPVCEYNPATDSWATKSLMRTTRYDITSSSINGKIYVFGGDTTAVDASYRSNINEEYDPATDTWTEKKPMLIGRAFATSVAVNGKIYVIGGSKQREGGGDEYVDLLEEYDPATDTWALKASTIPTPRYFFTSSSVNGKVYAIGGNLYDGSVLAVNEEYNPVTDTWTTKAPMTVPRYDLASSTVNGKIYALGGRVWIPWLPLSMKSILRHFRYNHPVVPLYHFDGLQGVMLLSYGRIIHNSTYARTGQIIIILVLI